MSRREDAFMEKNRHQLCYRCLYFVVRDRIVGECNCPRSDHYKHLIAHDHLACINFKNIKNKKEIF